MISMTPQFSAQNPVKVFKSPGVNFSGRPIGKSFPPEGSDQFVKRSAGDGSAPDFTIDSRFTLEGKELFKGIKELIQLETSLPNGLKNRDDITLTFFPRFLSDGGLTALAGAKVLVDELSANVNAQDPQTGYTPLIMAQQYRKGNDNSKTTAFLLARGANLRLADFNGNTPLHHAVLNQQYTTTRQFLETDPTLGTLKNKEGKTPLELASKDCGPNGEVSMYTLLNTPEINC